MIIYLAGSFFIYIYGEQLEKSQWLKFWYFTVIFYILRSIFFSIAIIIAAKSPTREKQLNEKKLPNLDIT
jgi:hypothetical protein